MSARGFLFLSAAALLLVWLGSGTGWMRAAPAFLRLALTALFVLAAVRIGLSIAIIAFDLSPASLLIPLSLGVLAWLVRPRGESGA